MVSRMDILKSHSDRDLKETTNTLAILNLSADLAKQVESADANIACKFVVVGNGDRQWLLFGTMLEFPYHANLVERFCTTHQLAYQWRPARDKVDITDTSYRIEGGGFIDVHPRTKVVRFSGSSKAYGSIPSSGLRKMLKGQTILAGFKAIFS